VHESAPVEDSEAAYLAALGRFGEMADSSRRGAELLEQGAKRFFCFSRSHSVVVVYLNGGRKSRFYAPVQYVSRRMVAISSGVWSSISSVLESTMRVMPKVSQTSVTERSD